MELYKVEKINLTQIGGRMGTETISIIWSRFYFLREKAIRFAEKDFAKDQKGRDRKIKQRSIKWKKNGLKNLISQDLGYCQYEIRKIKVYA